MSFRYLFTAVTLIINVGAWAAGGLEPLKPLRVMEIENVEGSIQHMAADVKGHRLFIALSARNRVEVMDAISFKHLASIPDLADPQEIAYEPITNRLFVTNGADGSLRIFDGTSLKLLSSKFMGGDAQGVRVLGAGKNVLVGYGVGGLAIMDGQTGTRNDVKLKSHPEAFQVETHGNRIYVSLPGISEIAVIDKPSKTLVDVWHVDACRDFAPMALDEEAKRMFLICRRPARLLVLDLDDGRVVASKPTVGDADDCFFDAARKRVYVIGGEGNVSVYQQKSADGYAALQKYDTTSGARTGLFVPEWNRLFVAARNSGPFAAELIIFSVED